MRVNWATIPGARWFLWDCERCEEPRHVMWVDDDLNEYEQALEPLHCIPGTDIVATRMVRCRKIVINAGALLILINPHEVGEPSQVADAVGHPVTS